MFLVSFLWRNLNVGLYVSFKDAGFFETPGLPSGLFFIFLFSVTPHPPPPQGYLNLGRESLWECSFLMTSI